MLKNVSKAQFYSSSQFVSGYKVQSSLCIRTENSARLSAIINILSFTPVFKHTAIISNTFVHTNATLKGAQSNPWSSCCKATVLTNPPPCYSTIQSQEDIRWGLFQLGWNLDGPHLAVSLRLSRRWPDEARLTDAHLSAVTHRVGALPLHLSLHGLLGLIGGLIRLAVGFLKTRTFIIGNVYPPKRTKLPLGSAATWKVNHYHNSCCRGHGREWRSQRRVTATGL